IGASSGPGARASNIVMRGLRFRTSSDDNLRVWRNAHDVVVDHCSFSGASDGGCDITEGAYNVTFSWNVLAKTAGGGKAQLLKYGASHVSLHHNLYFDNVQRNPQIAAADRVYSSGPAPISPLADFRYNVVFNYGSYGFLLRGLDGDVGTANVVSNLFF